MNKSNLELFKQAINEGLSKKIDSVVNSCTEKIVCSEKHNIAMRAIVYGKAETKRAWSPRMKRIIAILIAAALLLTSCGIIFRDQIREIFEEFFVKLTYSGDESGVNAIEEIYELTYLPEGYYLTEETKTRVCIQYRFVDENNNIIKFEQRGLDVSDFHIDSESGYSQIKEIEEYDVYYRFTDKYHYYIWNDAKYAMSIKSKMGLSNEQIVQIIDGIMVK